jgi:hypothetical protein
VVELGHQDELALVRVDVELHAVEGIGREVDEEADAVGDEDVRVPIRQPGIGVRVSVWARGDDGVARRRGQGDGDVGGLLLLVLATGRDAEDAAEERPLRRHWVGFVRSFASLRTAASERGESARRLVCAIGAV